MLLSNVSSFAQNMALSNVINSEDSHDSDIPEYFACMNKPLHQGSTITLCTAILALMDFCLSNHLAYTAIDGLLKLLQLLCV